jgi:N-acetylglucosamine kinase-like BadF-type ATPase
MFEAQRRNIDQRIDNLVFTAYDAGWNAAVEIFGAAVQQKHDEGDMIAVEVLRWALMQLSEEVIKNDK